MLKNIGMLDRIIRLLIAVILIVLHFVMGTAGIAGVLLLTLGMIFIITSFISFCPLYFPFGINTRKKTNRLSKK